MDEEEQEIVTRGIPIAFEEFKKRKRTDAELGDFLLLYSGLFLAGGFVERLRPKYVTLSHESPWKRVATPVHQNYRFFGRANRVYSLDRPSMLLVKADDFWKNKHQPMRAPRRLKASPGDLVFLTSGNMLVGGFVDRLTPDAAVLSHVCPYSKFTTLFPGKKRYNMEKFEFAQVVPLKDIVNYIDKPCPDMT